VELLAGWVQQEARPYRSGGAAGNVELLAGWQRLAAGPYHSGGAAGETCRLHHYREAGLVARRPVRQVVVEAEEMEKTFRLQLRRELIQRRREQILQLPRSLRQRRRIAFSN
jgi:hypothetical protein